MRSMNRSAKDLSATEVRTIEAMYILSSVCPRDP